MNTLVASSPASSIAELLGGPRALGHDIHGLLDAHDVIRDGMPAAAVIFLLARLTGLKSEPSLDRALGISVRTLQRRKQTPDRPLSQEQGGRVWSFAEILAKATTIFGSQSDAETWLETPAIGLSNARPIDLLATSAGAQIVRELLGRIEYGVYS